jgi:hypothetical protein
MTAGGLFLLSLISAGASLAYLIDTLVLLGLRLHSFSSPNTNAIMSSVAKIFVLINITVQQIQSLKILALYQRVHPFFCVSV